MFVLLALAAVACRKESKADDKQAVPSWVNSRPISIKRDRSGTLKIDPNPVLVCEKTGNGIATLSWTIRGTEAVEIHVEAPDGVLFGGSNTSASAKTGPWVRKGMSFFLQDVTDNAPRSAENTLANLTVDAVVPGAACP